VESLLNSELLLAFNTATAKNQRRNFSWNEHANWERIREQSRRGPVALESLPHAIGVPAVITGSGPSLDSCIERMKDFRGSIFCGASQACVLDANGIVPAYVVALDQHEIVAEQIRGLEWSRTVLITHVGIDPKVLDAWPGQVRYWLLPTAEEYDQDRVALAYPWLRSRFSSRGCTPNAAFQIAVRLGYKPVYHAGVDYAFTGGKLRCTLYRRIGYGRYEAQEAPDVEEEGLPRDDEGNYTTTEMLVYRHWLGVLENECGSKLRPFSEYGEGDDGSRV